MKEYQSLAMAESEGFVNLTGVAEALDQKRQTVHMWTKRRRTTNFPMPGAVYKMGKQWLHLYKLEDVEAWHATYVPKKGGAPFGNRNWVPRKDKLLTRSVE